MIEQTVENVTFLTNQWPLIPDQPTFVFIHGAGDSSVFWTFQLENFAGNINAIALDLPGHGRNKEAVMSSVADYAAWIDVFLQKAEIPSPVPCGLSMGGAITLQLLLDGNAGYPAGVAINSGAKLKVMPMIFDILKTDFKGYVDAISQFGMSPNAAEDAVDFVVNGLKETDPAIVLNDFTACNGFDVMDRLSEISVPVLALTADEDNLTPPKYGTFLADNIKEGVSKQVKGAGHLSPVEKPEEVSRALLSFLNDAGIT